MYTSSLAVVLAVAFVYLNDGVDAVDNGAESEKRLKEMYTVLHNVALPAPLNGGRSTKRLVLMLPGKVLYERDYHPGAEYLNSYSETNPDTYLDIPPIKMQNLFNLVDVVPGIDPLQGQESGESMSTLYRDILGRIDIKGIDSLAKDQQVRHTESVSFLVTEVAHPDNPDETITNWDLYRVYEREYNERKREMEETIDRERNNRTGLDYQYWFIRNFPILQADVDGAFMDWLIKGNKDLVELYRSRLGSSSLGTILLEAKTALRASGFTSLDRTKTIYPVSFVPGNWFEYLRDPVIPLTPEQINIKIAYLTARKEILEAMRDYTCDADTQKSAKEDEYDANKQGVSNNVTSLMEKRCNCFKNNNEGDDCDSYLDGLATLNNVASVSAVSYLVFQGFSSLAGNPDAINSEIERIDDELSELSTSLNNAGFGLPEIASVPIGPQPAPQGNWLSFEYSSKTTSQTETSERTSTSFSTRFQANYGLWRVGGSAAYSRQTADQFSSFQSRELRVSGELLRVTVQMPWFRPEIFREKRFSLTDPDYVVSPGPGENDEEYTTNVQNPPARSGGYRIPQYITGLLLCRNLSMEFGGVDQSSTYSFVATSLSTSIDVGYGPFSLSASFSRSSQKSSFQASSTATGMKIGVPGVQLIGYYTEITPQFPVPDE